MATNERIGHDYDVAGRVLCELRLLRDSIHTGVANLYSRACILSRLSPKLLLCDALCIPPGGVQPDSGVSRWVDLDCRVHARQYDATDVDRLIALRFPGAGTAA